MCSPPMLEMSKPSIRTGSRSRPSASWSVGERVDALAAAALAAEPVLGQRQDRVALARARAAGACRRARQRGPRPAPPRRAESASASTPARSRIASPTTTSRGTDRRRRVVLDDELLGHLSLAALALVGEVEAVALGEDAVADLEDLRVRLGALDRDGDQVGGVEGL